MYMLRVQHWSDSRNTWVTDERLPVIASERATLIAYAGNDVRVEDSMDLYFLDVEDTSVSNGVTVFGATYRYVINYVVNVDPAPTHYADMAADRDRILRQRDWLGKALD